ncbi:reverse transcriptase [Cucumis melo var. makuwa]|uniref:Reverse transcriptase n=1 Tax=Cucumis melo var. makuwa TaxID=1194695 RepID=A0A5D3C4C5_CUCMM|nr:reverse transcriptase [Cucumis melo var. makuwa]TYK05229.1 reverse transcriptase [Cucumis melo var. makuwa]
MCFEVHLEEDRTNAMDVLTTPATNSAFLSSRSSNHDNDKNNRKSIPVCEHYKKQWHTEDQCWKLYSRIPQSLGLISVDGKNPWIFDSRATNHLTGSLEHFISNIPCAGHGLKDDDLAPSCIAAYFTFLMMIPLKKKNSGDETKVKAETSNNETEQGHTRNLDEYDPSLDISIALRKDTKSCTKHPICNYVAYDNISLQFRAFTASFDSTIIPKNIYTALECPEWKNTVMEEMKALEKYRTW